MAAPRLLERLAQTVARDLPGAALPGLHLGRQNPFPHDQQGDRQSPEAEMVDTRTGDVVEGEQKGPRYELSKGNYVETTRTQPGGCPDRDQSHHRYRQLSCPRTRSTSAYLNHPYYILPARQGASMRFAVIRTP